MTVQIGKKLWIANQKRLESILRLGSEQVPFGIYAIEKDRHVEMRHDHCKSRSELKQLRRAYKARGYKVYANGV